MAGTDKPHSFRIITDDDEYWFYVEQEAELHAWITELTRVARAEETKQLTVPAKTVRRIAGSLRDRVIEAFNLAGKDWNGTVCSNYVVAVYHCRPPSPPLCAHLTAIPSPARLQRSILLRDLGRAIVLHQSGRSQSVPSLG